MKVMYLTYFKLLRALTRLYGTDEHLDMLTSIEGYMSHLEQSVAILSEENKRLKERYK